MCRYSQQVVCGRQYGSFLVCRASQQDADMSNHLDKERGPLCETSLYQKRMAVLLLSMGGVVCLSMC